MRRRGTVRGARRTRLRQRVDVAGQVVRVTIWPVLLVARGHELPARGVLGGALERRTSARSPLFQARFLEQQLLLLRGRRGRLLSCCARDGWHFMR